jgi:hypothetical protein
MNHSLLSLPFAVLFCAGCTALSAGNHTTSRPESGRMGNGIVITADQLLRSRSNLVQLLTARIANAQLIRVDGCETMQIRGRKSILSPVLPSVYVDGQHTISSCSLAMLNPMDIERVEIYPMGVTQRPGYHSSAGGLILVFLKAGEDQL